MKSFFTKTERRVPQELVMRSKTLVATTLNRLGTTVKSFQTRKFHESITESFREAIVVDPDNSDAIYYLAKHLSDHQTSIKEADLVGTRYEGHMPDTVPRSELVAELYRKVLSINPDDINAIIKLAICISNGVQIQKKDLAITRLTHYDPDKVDPNELEAELYRVVRSINPKCHDALYYLGMCFEERGIQIQASDLSRTKFERTQLEKVPSNDLAAEYYRMVIHLTPTYAPAYRHLAYCLARGASFEKEDLVHLKINARSKPKITADEVMLALYRKAVSLNARDSVALYHVASFILKGVPIEEVDLQGTKWVQADFMGINNIEVAASLYRKALENNPSYRLAIRQLGICIAKGASEETGDDPYIKIYNNLAESKKLISLALRLEKEDKPISKEILIGTCFAGQDPLKIRYPLIAEFYREAIKLDPHNSEAIVGLARCIEVYSVPLKKADLFGAEFEREAEINRNDAAAELYRKAILINPSHTQAIIGLAICIAKGAEIKNQDLYGTRHIGRLPRLVNRLELEAALYRKALIVDPNSSALYYLANSIAEETAPIEVGDLLGTAFEGHPLSTVDRYSLAAVFYRKLMILNPNCGKAARHLAVCIERGAPISPIDLVGTKLEGQRVDEVNIYQLIIALLVKAVLMDPKDQKSKKELMRFKPEDMDYDTFLENCKPSLSPRKRYCPQFESFSEKAVCVAKLSSDPTPEAFPKKRSVLAHLSLDFRKG